MWYYREMSVVLNGRVADEPRIANLARELERLVGEMGKGTDPSETPFR